jgi:phosphoglycolate phosphatase-like HAD superfamily hydrolase
LRSTIVLFDIDGTLIDAGGAGRASMELAFEEVAGRRDVAAFPYGGMTDLAIARQGLRAAGKDEPAHVERLLERYLHHLEHHVARTERFRVLPGVGAILDRLEQEAHLEVGLGTGNLIRGAELKLRRGALWERFAFGGFGSDHEERPVLLQHGVERGRARLAARRREGSARVVVIGDTPKDVAAAHAIGATCVAVATGHFTADSLAPTGADLVVDTLEDPRALAAILE